jgi:hypothetical protein
VSLDDDGHVLQDLDSRDDNGSRIVDNVWLAVARVHRQVPERRERQVIEVRRDDGIPEPAARQVGRNQMREIRLARSAANASKNKRLHL